jgi:hypothetical protein
MDYFYSQHFILQYSNLSCVSLPIKHFMFNLKVLPMSIKSISVFPSFYMFHRLFFMEVDKVEANQRMKLFYFSFDLLVDDDAAIILSSSHKMTKTSKSRLLPLFYPSCWSSCLHSNQRLQSHQRPSPTHPLAFFHFFRIVFAPLASSIAHLSERQVICSLSPMLETQHTLP